MLSHYRVLCESKRRTCLKPLVFFNKALLKLLFRHPNTNVVLQATWKPKGCNVNETFKLVASPMYLQMLGHNKKPFGIPDDDDLLRISTIFNHVYMSLQDYTIRIGSDCPVFGVVCFIIFIPYTYNGIYANYSSTSSILVQVTSAIYLHLLAVLSLTPSMRWTSSSIQMMPLINSMLQRC